MFQKAFKQPGNQTHHFDRTQQPQIQRSTFDRSHNWKGTIDGGWLFPILCDEVLPGDSFKLRTSLFARMQTLDVPFMDNIYMDEHYFFVPNRLIWNNWKAFMGAEDDVSDIPTKDYDSDFTVPQFASGTVGDDELLEYMGIPEGYNKGQVNSLHARAYNLIWNQWFRDQNLQDEITVDLDDGPDTDSDYTLMSRNKRHDYFTSCLPWPQKGQEISMPLGTSAAVYGNGQSIGLSDGEQTAHRFFGLGSSGSGVLTAYQDAYDVTVGTNETSAAPYSVINYPLGLVGKDESLGDNESGIYADLSTATAASINDIRLAFQKQKCLERDARSGTRYSEIIRSRFGINLPDNQWRPEYLGGNSTRLNVNVVPQTSERNSTDSLFPGELGGYGTFTNVGGGFTKSFQEYGVIIGLLSVRADLNYQTGVDRMWSRQTRWDYYDPAFAHLGEMAVLNREIFADNSANDVLVFGYQEHWADMRQKKSLIVNQLNSEYNGGSGTLDNWHVAEDFGTLPALNPSFIENDTPLDRVKALGGTVKDFIVDIRMDYKCARPMPTYSIPGYVDHF